MNPFIETLNRWGEYAIGFVWPMLWQSSVLIAVLFAADYALRRHVRAAVRHALWLVLLVKLLLPPSLALPTGLAWWVLPSAKAPAKPHFNHFTVNYGDAAPALSLPPAPVFTPPPTPPMSVSAGLLMAWSAVSLSLLAWLIIRWRRILRDLRRATPAPAGLNALLDDARRLSGWSRPVRLCLTDQPMSPALCGLFRPVILLPRPLAEKLSPAQLRAVLLHELVHLRRGDVWVNCLQALIQIVYWWHPLLWPANARIRRAREEAVDDTVMLALHDHAEVYAPTLLEVAKLAFHRPLASLGLVGILESRNSLRQRIERLVNFRAPRKAGLTFVSFCGVCLFSAAALPMDKPAQSAGNLPALQAATVERSLTMKVNPEVFTNNVSAQAAIYLHASTEHYGDILLDILLAEGVDCLPPHGLAFNNRTGEITTQNTPEALEIFRQVIEQLNRPDGKCALPLQSSPFHRKRVLIQGEFYKMRAADFDQLTKDLRIYHPTRTCSLPWWSIAPDQFAAFQRQVQAFGLTPLQRPRIQTGHGIAAWLFCGTETNHIELGCLPFVTIDSTQRSVELTVQVNTRGWFTDKPAGDGSNDTNSFTLSGQAAAEDGGGIVLRAENPAGDNLMVVLGIQIVTSHPPPPIFQERLRTIVTRAGEKPATNFGQAKVVPDTDHQNAVPSSIIEQAWLPPADPDLPANLVARVFKVDPEVLNSRVRERIGQQANLAAGFREILLQAGAVSIPPGSVYINTTSGLIYIRATESDLRIAEKIVHSLNRGARLDNRTNQDSAVSANASEDAKLLYEAGKFDEAERRLTAVLDRERNNQSARYYLNLVQAAKANRQWLSGVARTSPGRKDIVDKLDHIRFDQVSWPDGLPLSEVLRNLSEQTRLRDPDQKGINFLFDPNPPATSGATGTLPTAASTPVDPAASPAAGKMGDVDSIIIKLKLHDVRLADLLDAIVLTADHPIKYSIMDYGVEFSIRNPETPQLEVRTFKIDLNPFYRSLSEQTGPQTNYAAAFSRILSQAGVNLTPPKTVFFNDTKGLIFVRAAKPDMDAIEKMIMMFDYAPPQIHIKARFLAVPEEMVAALGPFPTLANLTNAATLAGVMAPDPARAFWRALETKPEVERLAEPEVTTLSGRQTQMQATDTLNILTGLRPEALVSPGVAAAEATNFMQIQKVEVGLVFDVVPRVRDDGCAIDLTVIASRTEFLGYAGAETNRSTIYVNGQPRCVSVPKPEFKTSQLQTHVTIWDNQTVLLSGGTETVVTEQKQASNVPSRTVKKRQLFVLFTATIIDPAGNRIHRDDELPAATTGIPPQGPP